MSANKFQGPKILTMDIETCPLEVTVWSLWDAPMSLDKLVSDWAVLSYSAKWMHEDHVMYEDTSGRRSFRNDKAVVKNLVKLLDEADIVIGQNHQKFDMRKVRARALQHGLAPFKEPVLEDTMLMARAVAAFTSNKLEYLSDVLTKIKKDDHREFQGYTLWLECMKGNPAAWSAMKTYNETDVLATEELYKVLRAWVKKHTNVAQYYDDNEMRCPRCGSTSLVEDGVVHRGVSTYQSYKCTSCTGHSRGRKTLNTKEKRDSLLVTI